MQNIFRFNPQLIVLELNIFDFFFKTLILWLFSLTI